jgi:outer membrane protein assembly factor BamB
MKLYAVTLLLTLAFFSLNASTIDNGNKWRGPLANGIYDQPNLLEKWPENGPAIVWVNEQLGDGFSSPVFANGKIYISCTIDSTGYLYIINESGELLQKHPYGSEFVQNFPGSRSTPTVVDNLVYIHTAVGKVLCMNETSGVIIWLRDLLTDFDGENLRFGMTESLCVDGDLVYVTPGGKTYNIIALNRFTGELVWSTPGMGDLSSYCTPLLFKFKEEGMLATMMTHHIVGVNRKTGELKWSHPYRNERGNHPNTPIYHNGELFCFSGYNSGGVKLRIADDNRSVEKIFWTDSLQSKMGGAVLVNGRLYGSGDNVRRWYCVDWETGNVHYTSKELANGVVIAANGLLYKYTDRGELALVKPGENGFELLGKTMVKHGTAQHWAHPVIYNGNLFVRHGRALIAYNVSDLKY